MMEGKRKVRMPFGTSAAASHIPWHQKEKEIPHLDNITCTHVRQQGTRGKTRKTMCALNLDSFSFDEHKNDVWVVVLYCQLSFALVNLAVL